MTVGYGALVRLWRRSADTTGTDAPVWPPPPASAMVIPARPRAADPLALPTVLRCVKLLTDVACQMRVTVTAGGQILEPPLWLRRPESFGTRLLRQRDIVELAVSSIATRGYAAWKATAAGASWILDPVDPARVSGMIDLDGTTRYMLDGVPVPLAYGPARRDGLLLAGFLVLPGRALPIGPLQAARETIGGYADTDAYAARVFRAGNTSGQVLATDQDLPPEKARAWQADWMAAHADPYTSKIPVLGNGLHLDQTMLNPKDAQWIEAREFGATEVARLMGVPANLLGLPAGGSLTYATARDNDSAFMRYTISGYTGSIEDAWSSLLPPGRNTSEDQRVRFDADPLLAPVTLDRYAAHASALGAGWMTVDEVRALEHLPALPTPPSVQGGQGDPEPVAQEAPA